MSSPQKIKGTRFEKRAAELLTELINNSEFKRIIGSGAFGTIMNDNSLTGDISGRVKRFPKEFKGEAKTGYSNKIGAEAKSFSLLKKWLDKIQEEAKNNYAFPFFIGHFDGARSGVKDFVILDISDFATLINMITGLNEELEEIYKKCGKT